MSNPTETATASAAARRDQFKAPVGNAASQRRRRQAITVGKERRDAVVRAKRMRRTDASDEGMMDDEQFSEKTLNEDTIQAVQDLKSLFIMSVKSSSQKRMEALRRLRRILSCSSNPPVGAAVETGIVPLLVKCLEFGSTDEQLVEAAWCLTNIASGDSEHTLAILPALPLLIAHLGERSALPVAEQCAWAVGNVAGEGEKARDILIAQGALLPLAKLLLSNKSTLAKTAAWALSNIIKGPSSKAAMELFKLDNLPEAITRHMTKGDEELVVEIAWVVVYITSLAESHTKILIKSGLLPPLIKWISSSDSLPLLTPVLRSIGNLVAGDNANTDALFDAAKELPGGLLGSLVRCLGSEHRTLQKEAAWAVSNIVAGSLQHKQLVFCSGVVPSLLHLLATSTFDVRKEVAYALGNLSVMPAGEFQITQPIIEHLTTLVERGCLPGFINLVKSPDLDASRLGLQFLELVLRGLPNGQGPKLVEKEGGLAALEVLEYHENDELRAMANELIDKYYGEDYGLEEEYGPGIAEVLKGGEEYPSWRRGWVVNS
ncbi:hypothetical protein GOP47_0010309 [Adiantum capillus-veneris]|uniref:Importin subunit alpha n=1 Tax=Adiantum capillus-veneris TaxID=13818 RepID=A0A9D4ZG69_ADICA|nr:hypothetical protein GOP47_0010309 [Adiantum capillus-veneris]